MGKLPNNSVLGVNPGGIVGGLLFREYIADMGDHLQSRLKSSFSHHNRCGLTITIAILLFHHKLCPLALDNAVPGSKIKIFHCITSKTFFTLLWERVNFTQRLSQ